VFRDSLISTVSLSDAIEALVVQRLVEERPMVLSQRRIWLDACALTECLLVDMLMGVNRRSYRRQSGALVSRYQGGFLVDIA